MLNKVILIIMILLFTGLLSAGRSSVKYLYVTNTIARVHKKPTCYSPVVGLLKFAAPVQVLKSDKYWVYVLTPKKNKGYISKVSLIDGRTMKRQATDEDGDEFREGLKGFSEDDEITAGAKGFSEEDEITAGTKGFSEEDEVTAGTKGFSKLEAHQKQLHRNYRYDLVDIYGKKGAVLNPHARFKDFRKSGELGEYK
ncbi:MAG TPA: SH3 domain-containing protein [Spirochaetes bacterium]|nr:SH3 domain-containing protein [Spirochaetota bacterium]